MDITNSTNTLRTSTPATPVKPNVQTVSASKPNNSSGSTSKATDSVKLSSESKEDLHRGNAENSAVHGLRASFGGVRATSSAIKSAELLNKAASVPAAGSALTNLKMAGPAAGTVGAALGLPEKISQAKESITKAGETGESKDIVKAAGDSSAAGSLGLKGLKNGVETVGQAKDYVAKKGLEKVAGQAFKQAVPGASKEVVGAASRKSVQEVTKAQAQLAQAIKTAKEAGKPMDEANKVLKLKDAQKAVAATAKEAAKDSSTLARGMGAATKAAAKELAIGGSEAAVKATAKAAAGAAAKSGGRFVPGVNVAIAALDVGVAAATLADKQASVGKKAFSVITAAGSLASATNIPGVSQAGAAVSLVSSIVGSFF